MHQGLGLVLRQLPRRSGIAGQLLFDKRKAKRGAWRVPEKTFFLVALLGGSPGAILGMRLFHHKTRHWYFKWGLPAILIAQLALGLWLFWTWNGRP